MCTLLGCSQTGATGFDSARCRLDDLAALVGGDGLDQKARAALGKLRESAAAKVETAATAAAAGKTKKATGQLGGAAKKLKRFGKKVVKLQPTHIVDPTVGAKLSAAGADALARVNALRDGFGD